MEQCFETSELSTGSTQSSLIHRLGLWVGSPWSRTQTPQSCWCPLPPEVTGVDKQAVLMTQRLSQKSPDLAKLAQIYPRGGKKKEYIYIYISLLIPRVEILERCFFFDRLSELRIKLQWQLTYPGCAQGGHSLGRPH